MKLDRINANLAKVDWAGMSWTYQDPLAYAELDRRISEAGRKLSLIVYSDLVRGIQFRIPNVQNGSPYTVDTSEWTGLDRAIIGSFLGELSASSYLKAGFLASALVVNKSEYAPSQHFFEWMTTLGVLTDKSDDTLPMFWADQVNKAHNYYGRR